MANKRADTATTPQPEVWVHWPVHWSGIWIGSLAAVAAVLVFGLVGIAVGAHLLGPENRVVDLKKLSIGAMIFSVCGAFFAFAIGGWAATKTAGILRAETGMLHGAVAWLVAVPILVVLAGLGAGSSMGGWYSGLGGTPSWDAPGALPFDRPDPINGTTTEAERIQYRAALADYQQKVKQWKEDTPKVTRNSALGAVAALLLGLMGSVIGGWMASGEPMNIGYYQTQQETVAERVKV